MRNQSGEVIMSNLFCSTRRGNLFLILSVFVPAVLFPYLAGAQQDIEPRVLDIIFRVEDLKGETLDLQMEETDTEIKIELSGDILFDFDKWNIRPEAEPVLTQVAEVINKYPKAVVLIEGYTDSKGSDSYNLKLSDKRAASVKDWLVKKGNVGNKKITTKGLGEADPVAPNENPDGSDNPEGRQKNRRVEITVSKG
jgi:outer membrane protein OmpA-like peptidoglycan-associated protein